MSNHSHVQIGQCVYSSLYGGRHGVIFNIHGEQDPGSVKNLCGVISSDGNAYFDVVFEDGSLSNHISECIIHGAQWSILDEMVTQDRIDELLSYHESESRRKEKEAHEASVKRDERREKLRQEYPYLKQLGNDDRSAKVGAANIRTELKRAFPGVKFSVRMSGGSAIDVYWTDGPTKSQVETITGKYQYGNFNGMEDIYERDTNNVWPDVFGGDNYVFEHRDYSDRLIQIAIDKEFEQHKANYEKAEIVKPTVEAFRKGHLYNVRDPERHFNSHSLQSDIHNILSEYSDIDVSDNTEKMLDSVDTDTAPFTVRNGTRPGYIEIIFKEKPEEDVRGILKRSGFRWSKTNGLWYGKSCNVPSDYFGEFLSQLDPCA